MRRHLADIIDFGKLPPIEERSPHTNGAQPVESEAWRGMLDARKFDISNPPAAAIPIYTLNEQVIATPGFRAKYLRSR